MNALVRVSAVLTNATYILNLDFDHYMNNSKALREAMCFMMDPLLGKRVCYVQFSQSFDEIDENNVYAERNYVFLDTTMRALDGIQGPIYVGAGSVFRRKAFYGYEAPLKQNKSRKRSCDCCPKRCCFGCFYSVNKNKSKNDMKNFRHDDDISGDGCVPIHNMEHEASEGGNKAENQLIKPRSELEKKFGQSPVFVASTLQENGSTVKGFSPSSLLREAIQAISCGYEDKTEWGVEVGWIYGSVTTENILTGFKMHCHGWRSIYCNPERSAFKGSTSIDLPDRLHKVLRLALGSVGILLSGHCPLWYGYGGGLKFLARLSYINATIYPLTSIPLVAYCTLPAVCLLNGKFIIPELSSTASLWFLSLFVCIFVTSILETRWSGVGIYEWWQNEQFRVMGGVSAHLVATLRVMLKVVAGVEVGEDEAFEWTTLLIPPTTLLLINMIGVIAGVSSAINTGYGAWGPLFGKIVYAFWVLLHLYPFLNGVLGGREKKRAPLIIIVWSLLIASVFSLLWIKIDPFLEKSNSSVLLECALDCNIL